jgi:hypothetical protein
VVTRARPHGPLAGVETSSEQGSAAVEPGADAQLEARVREHLHPGETLRAAVWVSRASAPVTRAEMSPFRFRRIVRDRPGDRRGVHGSPRSLAVGLDEHIRTVTDPRVLARTDRRVLVLAKPLFRAASGPLRLRWECPAADLAKATAPGGRLRLDFTDGSAVTLLTPAAHVQAFLAG